ncbi:MAG: DUF6553 family protein [Eubacterium sp.]|nr:DUF6553 family protein [Eubacterium sp.]
MEEQAWVYSYIRETDREKRRQILEEAIAAEGLSPENELRRKLLDSRYQKKNQADVDTFIRGFMNLRFLENASKGFFAKGKIKKTMQLIREDWCMDLAHSYGEAGDRILCQELCNMTRLYFRLCEEDRNYNAVLLGFGHISDESRTAKIAKEIYDLAYVIPETAGLTEELKLFTKAAEDTFRQVYPDSQSFLDDKIKKGKK